MVTGRRVAVIVMTIELCFSQLSLVQGHFINESYVKDELFHKVQQTRFKKLKDIHSIKGSYLHNIVFPLNSIIKTSENLNRLPWKFCFN